MMNIIYAALSISAQTEKTTFSCKDDCTWTKHTGRWTYSTKDFEIPLCHIPPPLKRSIKKLPNLVNRSHPTPDTILPLLLVGILAPGEFTLQSIYRANKQQTARLCLGKHRQTGTHHTLCQGSKYLFYAKIKLGKRWNFN